MDYKQSSDTAHRDCTLDWRILHLSKASMGKIILISWTKPTVYGYFRCKVIITVALQATLFEDIYIQSAQRQKKKKAAAGQTIFHAQMNVSVAALSIRAAVSFCSSEIFDDPNTV